MHLQPFPFLLHRVLNLPYRLTHRDRRPYRPCLVAGTLAEGILVAGIPVEDIVEGILVVRIVAGTVPAEDEMGSNPCLSVCFEVSLSYRISWVEP